MKNDVSVEHSCDVVEAIERDLVSGVIKDYKLLPLVDVKTCETKGHVVVLHVSSKYYYGEKVLQEWKKKLGSVGWTIQVDRGQLYIRFFVREKK